MIKINVDFKRIIAWKQQWIIFISNKFMELFCSGVLQKTNIMEANQILQTDILDIIFEGKNKSYGAYDLRKTYNSRVGLALLLMFSLIAFFIIGATIANKSNNSMAVIPFAPDGYTVHNIPPDVIPPPPPKPPDEPRNVEKVATEKFTTLKITQDDKVMETPPAMNEMDSKRIALEKVDGKADYGMIPPTLGETGTEVFLKPEDKKDDADEVKMVVQIEASFPGGIQKWSQYIQRTILNEIDEFGDSDYGTCVVKFIVDKTGKVSDVEATTMKGSKLAQVAVNAIRKGPNWIPAEHNGRKVNAYRLQPVTLRIADR